MSTVSEQSSPLRRRRSFSPEYKRDAAAMVIDQGLSIAEAARRLDVGESNLGNWVRQERVDRGERDGVTTDECTELAALRREVATLRMERELLKRATAFWVKESGQ
jgi:transposase